MPRETRSSALASSSKDLPHDAQLAVTEQQGGVNGAAAETSNDSTRDTLPTFEVLLPQLSSAAQALQREVVSLRNKNKLLVERLEEEDAAVQPRKGTKNSRGQTLKKLEAEKRALKATIRKLEKARERDKQKIIKLRMKEAKADAIDLQTAEFEVGDTAYHMRKLLRRFSDIVASPSLEEDEECPICMEKMLPREAKSLPCEHTFCSSCVSRLPAETQPSSLDDEPITIRCPQCRESCTSDHMELVGYTASQQWDALLAVAEDWANMDKLRREQDTSEEENSEKFIDNEEEDAEESSELSDAPTDAESQVAPSGPNYRERTPLEESPTTRPIAKKRRIAIASDSEPDTEDLAAQDEGQSQPNGNAGMSGPSLRTHTPPHTPRSRTAEIRSYAQSPSSEKRKRLESLAAARNRKRR